MAEVNKLRLGLEAMSHEIQRNDRTPIQWDETPGPPLRKYNVDNGYIHHQPVSEIAFAKSGIHFKIKFTSGDQLPNRALW